MAVVTWMERNDSCFLFRWDLTIDSFFLSFPFLLFSFLSFSFRFREIEFYFRIFRPANWLTSCYYRNKGIQYRNIIIIIIIITKARSFIIIFSFSPRCKRFSRDTDKNSYLYNRITHIQIFHPIGSSSRRNLWANPLNHSKTIPPFFFHSFHVESKIRFSEMDLRITSAQTKGRETRNKTIDAFVTIC